VAISPGDTVALTGLGYGYAVTGRRVEAQRVPDKLNELSKQQYISAVFTRKVKVGRFDGAKGRAPGYRVLVYPKSCSANRFLRAAFPASKNEA
jgi:hypothetical protein